jgi:hypothetical protein
MGFLIYVILFQSSDIFRNEIRRRSELDFHIYYLFVVATTTLYKLSEVPDPISLLSMVLTPIHQQRYVIFHKIKMIIPSKIKLYSSNI